MQAAEDILDKYRNIKRSSPSDGATGGTSYDGTGGENETALSEHSSRRSGGPHPASLVQIFAARTASTTPPETTPCRTSLPTISWTRPARRPGSTTPSFPSGLCPAADTQARTHSLRLSQYSLGLILRHWLHCFLFLVSRLVMRRRS